MKWISTPSSIQMSLISDYIIAGKGREEYIRYRLSIPNTNLAISTHHISVYHINISYIFKPGERGNKDIFCYFAGIFLLVIGGWSNVEPWDCDSYSFTTATRFFQKIIKIFKTVYQFEHYINLNHQILVTRPYRYISSHQPENMSPQILWFCHIVTFTKTRF